MRVDWKNMPNTLEAYDLIPAPDQIDWTDPTNVPCMVEAAVYEIGNLSECLSDDEHAALCVAAIDAMPSGRDAVMSAVQELCYELAVLNGWSDYLLDRVTGRYPWEP